MLGDKYIIDLAIYAIRMYYANEIIDYKSDVSLRSENSEIIQGHRKFLMSPLPGVIIKIC